MQCNRSRKEPVLCFSNRSLRSALPVLAIGASAILAVTPVRAQTLPGVYSNSWVGNTYGTPADHIAHTIDNLYVTPSGKVATITSWDEGGANAALYSSTGAKIGIPVQSGTGSWGRNSGKAIFANDNYIYQSFTQDGKNGNDPNGIISPPNNTTSWGCVRRYNHDGSAAPFTGGNGYDGSYLVVNSGAGYPPTGIVVYNGELYVSDPNTGRIRVYNASTMSQNPVRSFVIANVGLLDYDRLGFIWMLNTVQKKLIRFSKTGAMQSQSITFPSNVVPTAFCVDKVNDRILVTNNGNDQNVLIYTNIFGTPLKTSTFGNTGGINSGTAGAIAPLKFSEPKGVGIDSAGNIFVGNNGISGGARLEKYSSGGSLQWRLNGNVFTANGDLNPADETEFYTHDHKFKLNLGNTTSGSEWSLAAQTVNKVKYPGDIRIPPAAGTTVTPPYGEFWTTGYTRIIAGKKFLFTSNMYGSVIGIHRFNATTDGETAIPSGWMTKFDNIWRDANGNGSQDSGELETFGVQESPVGCFFYPDSTGGIWKTNGNGTSATGVSKLRYFPVQGLDLNGNPRYSYATSENYTLPELYEFIRVEYDAANDVMYTAGNSVATNMGGQWGAAGNTLVRYNNFRNNSTRSVAWSITLPFSTTSPACDLNVKAIAEAGDYLFLAAVLNGRIYVYNKSDGSKVGEILPTAATDNKSGWSDIVGAIRATKRSNGEYLIFAEENGYGKIMMYRWNPAPIATPTIRARFYPRAGYETRVVGGKFQGSADNSSWTDLGTVSSVPNQSIWTDLALSSVNYRYLRYLSPTNGYGNVAEIEFYDGTTKKTGTVFGTPGSWSGTSSDTADKAMDGNTATFYDAAANTSDAHVGIDTGNTSANTNLITNPSFDAEAFDTQTPSGWAEWESTGAATSSYTETYLGANSGARHGTHWNTAAYQVYTYQTKTGLANGLYTLKGYFKRGGNQTACTLEAKDFGSTTKEYRIPVLSAWTPVEIKDINVTNGQCTIGIWSDANAQDWLFFDDISFTKQ